MWRKNNIDSIGIIWNRRSLFIDWTDCFTLGTTTILNFTWFPGLIVKKRDICITLEKPRFLSHRRQGGCFDNIVLISNLSTIVLAATRPNSYTWKTIYKIWSTCWALINPVTKILWNSSAGWFAIRIGTLLQKSRKGDPTLNVTINRCPWKTVDSVQIFAFRPVVHRYTKCVPNKGIHAGNIRVLQGRHQSLEWKISCGWIMQCFER